MNINNFLNVPLVKIVVTILFFYYIFEQTKDDPKSASYQLKNADFDQSVSAIKTVLKLSNENVKIINKEDSVTETTNQNTSSVSTESNPTSNQISFSDLVIGQENPVAICGSEALIQYAIQDKDAKTPLSQATISIKIGSKLNKIIEKGLIGMKIGGVRLVNIPENFTIGDVAVDNAIKTKKMFYKISLFGLINPKKTENCEL
jgi:hypothetical protein